LRWILILNLLTLLIVVAGVLCFFILGYLALMAGELIVGVISIFVGLFCLSMVILAVIQAKRGE